MSRTFDYLVCFSVYSLIILIIGKSSFGESDSIGKFFIGERKCGFWRLFCTFVGTWVSAATILGYTGNVFENGTSVIAVTVIPWFIGAGLLYLISGRIYDCDLLTIPQFIGDRYHSRLLRTCCALLLSSGYVFYLVIQIKGFGIAAATLLNIDYKVAIFLAYLFILYSTFGGFNSVTKTDGGNLIMLTISIVVVYFVVVGGIEGSGFLTNAEVFNRNAAGSGTGSFGNLMKDYSLTMYLTMFFGWGMGLATNPQYLIRIVAAKSCETARKVLIWSLVFLTFFYFCLTQIGLGLRILFPYLHSYFGSDDIFVYAINYLIAVQRIFPDQRDRRVHVYGELAAASDWLDDVLRCGGAVWKMEENRGPHPGADAALYLSWRNAGASALLKSTVQQPVFRRGYLGIVFSNSDTASLRYALL